MYNNGNFVIQFIIKDILGNLYSGSRISFEKQPLPAFQILLKISLTRSIANFM